MNTNKSLNMTMLCDFYELTMGNGYFKAGYQDRITHFDLFFRNVPDKGGYAIAAGLEQVIEYIQCDYSFVQPTRSMKIQLGLALAAQGFESKREAAGYSYFVVPRR